jgi:hypothetical protein
MTRSLLRGIFMTNLTIYYPLFWALCVIIAAFGLMMLDIMIEDAKVFFTHRRMKLRDKLHFSMMQNRGAT